MISKIFLAAFVIGLALFYSTHTWAQVNPTPSRPGPVKGQPTRTKTPTIENVITSKLLIFSKDGKGTTSTNLVGEFGAQLTTTATVDREFSLQWSRSNAGAAAVSRLYIHALGNANAAPGFVPFMTVNLPAQSLTANIGVTMPTPTPGTYELKVIGASGSSSKVTVTFTGKGGGSSADVTSSATPVPSGTHGAVSIIGAVFSPAVGAPGVLGYKRAKITLSLRASETTDLSSIEVEVLSQSWTNSGLVTTATSKNSPITILKGKVKFVGGTRISKDKVLTYPIVLRRTTKNDIDDAESGPGFYAPADWGLAFAQTNSATFRWKVDDQLVGSTQQSPKSPWQWGAP